MDAAGRRLRRDRLVPLEVQNCYRLHPHEGKAAAPRLHESRDAVLDGAVRRSVLAGIRLEVGARRCRVHLRARDGARRDAAAFRDPGHGTDVSARNRSGHSQPILSDRRGRPGTRRSRGANLGSWSRAYVLLHLPADGSPRMGRAGGDRSVDQPFQPDAGVAARRAHGFKALTRQQRWIAVAAVAVAWGLSSKGILVLLLIAAAWAALGGKAPERPDRRTLLEYVVLVAALTALATIPVPVTALD